MGEGWNFNHNLLEDERFLLFFFYRFDWVRWFHRVLGNNAKLNIHRGRVLCNRHHDFVRLALDGVIKTSKLMWQLEIKSLVSLELVNYCILKIWRVCQLLTQCSSGSHISAVVAPSLFSKAIIEVFIHILAVVLKPWFRIVIKFIPVDLRHFKSFKLFVFYHLGLPASCER